MIQINNGNLAGKTPEDAITPSKLNNLARITIEKQLGSIWLNGEVTDLYMAPSGHAYFSLKDNRSSVKCTFFKQYNFKKIIIKNGDSLLAFGKTTLYEERGTFQLKVERVENSGIGDIAKAFAKLKLKLETQGYFSQDKKQTLPAVINSIGIVTSKSSAAIKDVLNVIKRRNPLLNVYIYHASVQGDNAVEEIIDALLIADIKQHDVILLTRGGGSEEDLWTFNDISIAQTLFNLTTPCVSAIGHEKDTAISDLVADAFAITPSAAAELLTPDLLQLKLKISHNSKIISQIINNKVDSYRQQLDINYHKLEKSHPTTKIKAEKQLLQKTFDLLNRSMNHYIQQKNQFLINLHNNFKYFDFNLNADKSTVDYLQKQLINSAISSQQKKQLQLKNLSKNLNNLSPLSILSRSYSITLMENTQTVLSDIQQVTIGDNIETQLKSGKITSQVTSIKD